jgi:PIN domain nuclease of toxin-antitoxin system
MIVGVADTHTALWYLQALRQVPRAQVPDMPDRIVAATAVYLGVPVISRDARIQSSIIQTVW